MVAFYIGERNSAISEHNDHGPTDIENINSWTLLRKNQYRYEPMRMTYTKGEPSIELIHMAIYIAVLSSNKYV